MFYTAIKHICGIKHGGSRQYTSERNIAGSPASQLARSTAEATAESVSDIDRVLVV